MAGTKRFLILLLLAMILIVGVIYILDFQKPTPNIFPTLDLRPEEAKLVDLDEWKKQIQKRRNEPEEILDLIDSMAKEVDLADLGIQTESVIADIGCGTGTFEMLLLAKKVTFARLYALDIDKKSLDFLRFVIAEANLENKERIVLIHSKPYGVMLPPDSVDIALTINTRLGMRRSGRQMESPETQDRDMLYGSIKKALKPGAKFHVYEPVRSFDRVFYPEEYVMEPFLDNGFRLLSKQGVYLNEDCYYMVFTNVDI